MLDVIVSKISMCYCKRETACLQAIWQDARRKAAWANQPWIPAIADILPVEVFGPFKQPWPQVSYPACPEGLNGVTTFCVQPQEKSTCCKR